VYGFRVWDFGFRVSGFGVTRVERSLTYCASTTSPLTISSLYRVDGLRVGWLNGSGKGRGYPDGEVFDILGIHHLLPDQLLRQNFQHTLPFALQGLGFGASGNTDFRASSCEIAIREETVGAQHVKSVSCSGFRVWGSV